MVLIKLITWKVYPECTGYKFSLFCTMPTWEQPDYFWQDHAPCFIYSHDGFTHFHRKPWRVLLMLRCFTLVFLCKLTPQIRFDNYFGTRRIAVNPEVLSDIHYWIGLNAADDVQSWNSYNTILNMYRFFK